MTTNELRVLEIIWDWGGEASVDTIAREAGISINYARVLCESLKRENYMDFLPSKLYKIRGKGKLDLIKRKNKSPSKIAIDKNSLDSGRDKRGKLILNY